MTFLGVLEVIGKDFAKGLKWAVTYALPVEKLVGLLFPAAAPEAALVGDALALIQTAVLAVEQKFAAAGAQQGTGAQKLAEVLVLAENTVLTLLAKAGVTASHDYVVKLVNAVVALLNVQPALSAQTAAK